jgi:phospholipid/cholesterol/gamma-HCH transport system permease protein
MNPITAAGAFTHDKLTGAGFSVRLLLRAIAAGVHLPRRWRFFVDQCYIVGVRALPVTVAVATIAGMILAMQTGIELKRFGLVGSVGNVTALSMCREMSPFITGVILAATVGSAMAAELGTMTVSDEVTALEVMSIDPIDYLAMPRIFALTLMCPVLTALSDLLGSFGGAIVAASNLGVSPTYYWRSVYESLRDTTHFLPKDVFSGVFKALVFGATIATLSCAAGLRASGGALGVGFAVTQAVKNSVLMIIVEGLILTWFFYYLVIS